jgi:pyruvate formate lyase activating enzyme
VSLVIDDSTPAIPESEIFRFLRARRGFLDGVAISGGEPTLHPDLPKFIRRIRRLGYQVKLDTNGTNPAMLEQLIGDRLVDYIAMDIKAPFEKYEQVVKVRVRIGDVRRSYALIVSSPIDHEMRTTVVPHIHSRADILCMASQIRRARRYYLQQFKPIKTIDPRFMHYRPPGRQELEALAKACTRYLPTLVRA